jgi:hypothetical protein
MLGRVVDRLAEDRRARPKDLPAVWVLGGRNEWTVAMIVEPS